MIDWQIIAVIVLAGIALGYLALQFRRSWRSAKAGCGGCGCARKVTSAPASNEGGLMPPERLRLKTRRAEKGG